MPSSRRSLTTSCYFLVFLLVPTSSSLPHSVGTASCSDKLDLSNITGILKLSPQSITAQCEVYTAISTVNGAIGSGSINGTTIASAYSHLLDAIVPGPAPASASEVISIANATFGDLPFSAPINPLNNALEIIIKGINIGSAQSIVDTSRSLDNDPDWGRNIREPATPVFPQKAEGDAPYSLNESTLRGALHIPEEFQFGAMGKQPVILVPGTGVAGSVSYAPNFLMLLSNITFADPVILNIPGISLNDAQVTSEFVAYAINYISGISNNVNVSAITWSLGSLNTQWALKFWPSTRSVLGDFIAVSPEFKGSNVFSALCPGGNISCNEAILQQKPNSNFISTLRANDGDSAFVPTTTLYSSSDDVIQPQNGTAASGFILDTRGVGVSNNEIQLLCPGEAAGGPYLHDGMLVNPIAYALAIDALQHPGPGLASRVDLANTCQNLLAPQLSVENFIQTSTLVPLSAFNQELYPEPKVFEEPPLMSYTNVA